MIVTSNILVIVMITLHVNVLYIFFCADKVSLGNVMSFFSGAEDIPPTGYIRTSDQL